MSLPCPAELSNIEIEDAHTPVPRGGSGSSPTSEVVARSPRREHVGGGGFVTLKRKGSSDIVRQAHARSASLGTCSAAGGSFGGTTPMEPETLVPLNLANNDSSLNTNSTMGAGANPSPSSFQRMNSPSGVGGGIAQRGSWGGSVSTIVSLEDAAQRIAVDPDSGHSYFVERPTVCDACPYCEDVCEVAWCNGCDERRMHLEEAYGPLMLSTSESGGINGGLPSPATLCSRDEGDAGEAGGESRTRNQYNARPMAPVLSRRYPRKSSYTPCEVRRRKLTGACWIVSQGSVYDVTGALADHPGGKRSVLRNAGGRDCSEDFFFHSKAAKKQWRQYRIGSLVSCNGEGGTGQGDGERSTRTGSDCVIS